MLDELVVIAAVGTSRKAPALSSGDLALDAAFAALDGASAEARLLGAVTLVTQYESCGRLPTPASTLSEVAAGETLPPCSQRAGDLLAEILVGANGGNTDPLVGEWLLAAVRADVRAPHRLLPALLEYGASHRNRRRDIAQVAGTRGAWLMRLNPRWQYEIGQQEDPTALWATGARDQRVAAITRLHATDPAAARALIQSTWNQDAAEERSMFVAAITPSLHPDDEPFLESALDDRSKQVRAAAAELLTRLPESAFVKRMIARAAPLLTFSPAKKSGLLRKLTPAILEIALPPDKFDPAWARDGIVEKPEEKIGQRQWWLRQLISAIPPAYWSAQWEMTPAAGVAAAMGEFADVVLAAWHTAAARHPDPKWIEALLLAAAKENRGPLTLGLLNLLPEHVRDALAAEVLESPRADDDVVGQLLRTCTFPFDRHSAAALLGHIERRVEKGDPGYRYALAPILREAAVRVPPIFYDELAQRWTGPSWEPNRKAADEFFQILKIRKDLHREFTS